MSRTTKYRRSGPTARLLALALALLLLGVNGPSRAQEAVQDDSIESIATIRAAADSYVKSLLAASAGRGENVVTVGALDNRLRRARCCHSILVCMPSIL